VRIFLLVVFGAAGTLARYGLQGLVQHRAGTTFPAGTLTVNLLGCFLLGGVAEYGFQHLTIPPDWRIAITVGFFGAFTTFSSFSYETVRLLEDGEWPSAALYLGVSIVGGLLLMMFGMRIGDLL
jgi:fluoride exporter